MLEGPFRFWGCYHWSRGRDNVAVWETLPPVTQVIRNSVVPVRERPYLECAKYLRVCELDWCIEGSSNGQHRGRLAADTKKVGTTKGGSGRNVLERAGLKNIGIAMVKWELRTPVIHWSGSGLAMLGPDYAG